LYISSNLHKELDFSSNTFIILGGDAPCFDGKICCFTTESVDELFSYVKKNVVGKIILQNGPRTGKYDLNNTSKIVCDHTWGEGSDIPKNDAITQYFIDLCNVNNISCMLYPFHFKITEQRREVISYYKPLLYLQICSQSTVLIPGDSVSMLAELTALLLP